MPGLTFVFSTNADLKREQEKLNRSLDALIHSSNYSKRTILSSQRFALACTRHPDYPFEVIELPDYLIAIEGRLYGLTEKETRTELHNLAKIIYEENDVTRNALVAWLLARDGDFVVVALRKATNEIAILNDALGRLPLYFSKDSDYFILSREVRFIVKYLEHAVYDKLGIAEFLLFGYPLGTRTLFENIARLQPATLLRFNGATGVESAESLHVFNFDSKQNSNRTVDENATALAALFRVSCQRQASRQGLNLVSLSGGLDSRVVASGFHEESLPFICVSYIDRSEKTARDVVSAGNLASTYRWNWRTFKLNPPHGRDLLFLLRTKNALNPLSMGFIIPFFEMLREGFGTTLTYFTGDGGDKVLPDLTPTKHLDCVEDLAEFVLRVHQRSSLATVTSLMGLKKSDILTELVSLISNYPEHDLKQKYVHFLIYERAMKWLFEGEDRNRFYFWSATPFYSIHFFSYAMNCPDNQKAHYLLYRRFIEELSDSASHIVDSGVGLPPRSWLYGIKRSIRQRIIEALPPRITLRLIRGSPYSINSAILNCLKTQLENCPALNNYFSKTSINNVIAHCQHYSRHEVNHLFSVSSIIEDFERKTSSLEQYQNLEFI